MLASIFKRQFQNLHQQRRHQVGGEVTQTWPAPRYRNPMLSKNFRVTGCRPWCWCKGNDRIAPSASSDIWSLNWRSPFDGAVPASAAAHATGEMAHHPGHQLVVTFQENASRRQLDDLIEMWANVFRGNVGCGTNPPESPVAHFRFSQLNCHSIPFQTVIWRKRSRLIANERLRTLKVLDTIIIPVQPVRASRRPGSAPTINTGIPIWFIGAQPYLV